MQTERNSGTPAQGKVVVKLIDGKPMVVVKVNRRHWPFEDMKWGSWEYKISNYSNVKNKIKDGDTVDGTLFRFKLSAIAPHTARFHVISVISNPNILDRENEVKVQP